ncbi:MAG: hypothetical protein WCA98_13325 [Candidatus Acidiferrales bacterium]
METAKKRFAGSEMTGVLRYHCPSTPPNQGMWRNVQKACPELKTKILCLIHRGAISNSVELLAVGGHLV